MTDTIVIYHGGCRDGFCSAWVFNKYMTMNDRIMTGEPEYYPGFYGQEPPNIKDKNVIILDFAYPLEVMQQIYKNCRSLTWLDHHKTAQPVADWFNETSNVDNFIGDAVKFDFDNSRSGAGLAWEYFFPNEPRPWLVDYVEDRDLWIKKLPDTDEVNSYIACLEFDFKVWNNAGRISKEEAAERGKIAIMKIEQYVREVCKNVYFVDIINSNERAYDGAINWIMLDDKTRGFEYKTKNPNLVSFEVPTVNICQVDCSEVLHQLCISYPNAPFSLYWFKRADGMYQYGMRSIGDFDVSKVAKLFGGGGHKNAAGFQLNYLLEELK